MAFLIAAAGTGGHVFPGLAVGEALIDLGVAKSEIVYVGGDRLEATVYPEEGYRFVAVELAGLKRSVTLENLRIPAVVMRARTAIARLIEEADLDVVLGMGGYVTIPTAMAARRTKRVFFNAEQNAEAGLANRVTARWARETFVAFPDTVGLRAGHWVGNPVREVFWDFDRDDLRGEAMSYFDLPDDIPVVGVFGGSLGAGSINEAVVDMIESWSGPAVSILHLTGEAHLSSMAERARTMGSIEVVWRTLAFVDRMDLFYGVCDLVVARAGGAVAELTATGTPSVLVPGQFGSGGHQEENARALERAGAAVMLDQQSLDRLPDTVSSLITDRERREGMAQAAVDVAKPDAARTIAGAMIEAIP